MKKSIATLILALSAAQANAEGFYQLIVGDAPQSGAEIGVAVAEFSYSPLYLQVIGGADRPSETGTFVPEFTYTPLYLQVAAHTVNRGDQI